MSTEISANKKKKGIRNISDYRGEKIKRARLLGTEYINYNGNIVPAKKTGEACRLVLKYYVDFNNNYNIKIISELILFYF